MNKNWLYRILALALVAMLALPMFALAEEDVFSGKADATVEETEVTIGGVEKESKQSILFPQIVEVELGKAVTQEVKNLAGNDFDANADRGFSIFVTEYDSGYGVSFKSSNKKAATVDPSGNVYLVGPGDVTITIKGKIPGRKSKVTSKIKFTVKDKSYPDSMYVLLDKPGNNPGIGLYVDTDDLGADGDTLKVLPGEGLIGTGDKVKPRITIEPVPFNADGDYIFKNYRRGYSWKWSKTSIAYWNPVFTDCVTKIEKASGMWYPQGLAVTTGGTAVGANGPLYPVFYKPGTTKLTFKTMACSGNKSKSVTVDVKVKENKKAIPHAADKSLQDIANDKEIVIYALDEIDVQSIDKVVIKIKVYNGTKVSVSSLKKVKLEVKTNTDDVNDALVANCVNDFVYVDGNVYANNDVKGSIKAGKTSTITITATNERKNDFTVKPANGKGKPANEIKVVYQKMNELGFAAEITQFSFKGFNQYLLTNAATITNPFTGLINF